MFMFFLSKAGREIRVEMFDDKQKHETGQTDQPVHFSSTIL